MLCRKKWSHRQCLAWSTTTTLHRLTWSPLRVSLQLERLNKKCIDVNVRWGVGSTVLCFWFHEVNDCFKSYWSSWCSNWTNCTAYVYALHHCVLLGCTLPKPFKPIKYTIYTVNLILYIGLAFNPAGCSVWKYFNFLPTFSKSTGNIGCGNTGVRGASILRMHGYCILRTARQSRDVETVAGVGIGSGNHAILFLATSRVLPRD